MLFKQFFIFEWNLKIALKLCTRALDTIASIYKNSYNINLNWIYSGKSTNNFKMMRTFR